MYHSNGDFNTMVTAISHSRQQLRHSQMQETFKYNQSLLLMTPN